MPFKIIQTRERGRNVLQIIPEKWEQNNILHWPKRNVEKLLEMEESEPDDSWMTMKCMVKRTNLFSKNSAEMEIARMSDMSDTDADEERPKTNKKYFDNNNTAVQECFNDLASSCLADNVSTLRLPAVDTSNAILHLPETSNAVLDQNVIYITAEEAPTKSVETTEIIQKLDSLTEKFKSLEESLSILCNIMQSLETNLLQKLAHITTTFNAFVELSFKDDSSLKEKTIDFIKISDKKSLDKFEENLKNPSFKANIKNQLSLVCGKGKGRGNNNAYALSDVLFSRNFLTQCSWTGGSRKECTKICFKVFRNTVDLFFELIHQSDNNYTKQECETFLKNIMRHSNTRNKVVQRSSAGKSRSKKQSQKKPTNVGNQSSTTVNQSAGSDVQSVDIQPAADFNNQPAADSDDQPVIGSNVHSAAGSQHQSITGFNSAVGSEQQPVADSNDQLAAGSKKQLAANSDDQSVTGSNDYSAVTHDGQPTASNDN